MEAMNLEEEGLGGFAVSELKQQLKDKGLSTKGRKGDLIACLQSSSSVEIVKCKCG